MTSFFRQPFPSFYPSVHAVGQCAIAGLSVFLVLFVLQPFGMDNYTNAQRLLVGLGYGFITFLISVLFTCLLPYLLPSVFDEARWNVAREFVFFIAVTIAIAVANLFFSHLVDGTRIQPAGLFRSVMITFSVAFVPVSLAILLKQQRLYKKYKKDSEELSGLIEQLKADKEKEASGSDQAPENTIAASPRLEFTGNNSQESISCPPDDLLVVSAADNYVRVQYTENNKIKQAVLRGALKNIENQLSQFAHLLRCHRSYIVNLRKVNAVSGNAQGYKLHIAGLEEPVPVGRNYNAVIKERLQHLWD